MQCGDIRVFDGDTSTHIHNILIAWDTILIYPESTLIICRFKNIVLM